MESQNECELYRGISYSLFPPGSLGAKSRSHHSYRVARPPAGEGLIAVSEGGTRSLGEAMIRNRSIRPEKKIYVELSFAVHKGRKRRGLRRSGNRA